MAKDKILGQEFNDKQPSTHNQFRDRNYLKEISSPFMKYQPNCMRDRVQEAIKTQPIRETECLNTLLIAKPKWREHNQKKWMTSKDFISQNSPKDKWESIPNNSIHYPEPYIAQEVKFRSTFSSKKNSLINDYNNFGRASIEQEPDLFDSTIPHDKTWSQRAVHSMSLRQRQHMNQTLKIKKQHNHFNAGIHPKDLLQLSKQDEGEVISSMASPSPSPEKKVMKFFQQQQQLSQILSEASMKNKKRQSPSMIKEKIIKIENAQLDNAAQYLNNNSNQSYVNAWQYQCTKPQFNKRFSLKEELNEEHIISELDKVKTYYGSVMGRIQPEKLRSQDKSKDIEFQKSSQSSEVHLDLDKITKRFARSNQVSPRNNQSIMINGGQKRDVKEMINRYFEKINKGHE